MVTVRQTSVFAGWLRSLRDANARARINTRIRRVSLGNPGDVKPVGSGISELRIDYGPGYRIYYVEIRGSVILLLCGGDKSSQEHDIKTAKVLAQKLD